MTKRQKNRQHNGQKKKYKQRSTKHAYNTKDRVTQTPLNHVFTRYITSHCYFLHNKLDIYEFITINGSMPLPVDYKFPECIIRPVVSVSDGSMPLHVDYKFPECIIRPVVNVLDGSIPLLVDNKFPECIIRPVGSVLDGSIPLLVDYKFPECIICPVVSVLDGSIPLLWTISSPSVSSVQ
jgi:hypothetical protein